MTLAKINLHCILKFSKKEQGQQRLIQEAVNMKA